MSWSGGAYRIISISMLCNGVFSGVALYSILICSSYIVTIFMSISLDYLPICMIMSYTNS
jgi:hypothetical protein